MAYLVLARKYRPRTFAEVVGQSVSTGVLRGALEDGRVGHAYLFSGPRGTGKTTTARIFAKALNCEKGPAVEPCGTCDRCQAADDGSEVDIVEIDAASNTGVDNIRDLRDQAAYAPMRARYKIYIVDEVHMLSKGAFNALLKTLEEPPPHVKFLFATTEPHKVPDTVLSRCQVLRLDPITESEIVRRLEEVSRAEGFQVGEGVLSELARRARGGMRDALSLFDQLIALVGTSPGLADVARLGGERGPREVDRLLGLVERGDRAGVITTLAEMGGSESELLEALLGHLRSAVVVGLCGADTPLLAGDDNELARARAERLPLDRLELWLEELLYARERLRLLHGQERLVLEMALLALCREESSLTIAELQERLFALEARLEGAASAPTPAAAPANPSRASAMSGRADEASRAVAPPARPSAPAPAPARKAPTATASAPTGVPSTTRDIWEGVIAELSSAHGSLAEMLRNRGRLESLSGDAAIVRMDLDDPSDRRMFEGRRNATALKRAFKKVMKRDIEVSNVDEAPPPPKKKDGFTQGVADLFGGVVEEER
jgi:DNA polymerase-3 subunit gamma/tau